MAQFISFVDILQEKEVVSAVSYPVLATDSDVNQTLYANIGDFFLFN